LILAIHKTRGQAGKLALYLDDLQNERS